MGDFGADIPPRVAEARQRLNRLAAGVGGSVVVAHLGHGELVEVCAVTKRALVLLPDGALADVATSRVRMKSG